MAIPSLCRVALIVEDMATFTEEMNALLGLQFLTPPVADKYPGMTIRFGDHGLEPIQLHQAETFSDGRFVEAGLDVASAEVAKESFINAGYKQVMASYLPIPGTTAYLFGRDFHNVPLMFCTVGTGEIAMRISGPFEELSKAKKPKIGCLSLTVDNIEQTAKDMNKLLGMEFVSTDPAGLGTKALVGEHRIKLIEGHSAFSAEFEPPLAAIEMIVDDVEQIRTKIESAGYPVKYTRPLNSGGNAYYFGAISQHLPLTIYPENADNEILGLKKPN